MTYSAQVFSLVVPLVRLCGKCERLLTKSAQVLIGLIITSGWVGKSIFQCRLLTLVQYRTVQSSSLCTPDLNSYGYRRHLSPPRYGHKSAVRSDAHSSSQVLVL